MNRVMITGLLLAAMAFAAGPASAQESVHLKVIPRIGLWMPDDLFYEEFKNFSGDGFVEWTNGSLGRAAYVGMGLEVAFGDGSLLVRGEVGRTFEGWLTAGHGVLIPRALFEPPQVVTTWFDVPTSMTLLGLQLVLPTRFDVRGIQPYVLAGYGGKWYGFGDPTRPNEVEAILPGDGFTHSLELGAGVAYRLFGFDVDAQLKDSINKYWSKTQHDLVVSAGVAWTIR